MSRTTVELTVIGTGAVAVWAAAPTVARSTSHRLNETLIRRGYQADFGIRSREGQSITRWLRITTAIASSAALLAVVTNLTGG